MTPSEIADWLTVGGEWAAAARDHEGAEKHYEAADTIRELEAKLKIATEALEDVYDWLSLAAIASAEDMAQGFGDKFAGAGQALARIKEVG